MTDADERKDERTGETGDDTTVVAGEPTASKSAAASESEAESKADATAAKAERKKERKPSQVPALISKARLNLSRLIWLICVLAALVLAVAALLIALSANKDNGLVKAVLDLAKVADVNVFSLDSPIKQFHGSDVQTKTALLNYGLGALAWLVVGRIVAAVVRPRS